MKKQKSFEESMQRLEEIVALLEGGRADLGEAMAAFEEGVALVRECNDTLTHAEKRVRVLLAGENGEMTEAPFVSEEADV